MYSLQWGAAPGRSIGEEGLLEEDVQVAERRQRHQQPIGAGHIGVHHRTLWHHHGQAIPIQIPSDFPPQETQATNRYSSSLRQNGYLGVYPLEWTLNHFFVYLWSQYQLCRHYSWAFLMSIVLSVLKTAIQHGNTLSNSPHLYGLSFVRSCAIACRGTVRLPLTRSVLRMWMWSILFICCLCHICLWWLSACRRDLDLGVF